MEREGESIKTDITEEQAVVRTKWGRRVWIFVLLGGAVLIVAATMLVRGLQKPLEKSPRLTAEELEQLKYDSEQQEREKQKAAQIRDQSFLVRKDEDNQAQLNSLLKDLDIQKDSGPTNLPTPLADHHAKAEEEAIAHVLRGSTPARPKPEPEVVVRRRAPEPVQTAPSGDTGTTPMFVYSRNFGGAKYVDVPQKQNLQPSQITLTDRSADSSASRTKIPAGTPPSADQQPEELGEEKTHLVYTDHPPITLYEGEILEAVLVNRIIADTEPSPVICHIAKDVFDHSARYVVFPANSRIVGASQVVTYKGAHRLFISFNRIILPNGPSVDLPSSRKALKALDQTGALGVVSKVERHWFLRFGTSIFFGVLDGLSGAAQRNRDVFSTRSVVLGRTSENFDRILENIMAQYSTIVPTIRVDQGKTMKIYLSDDIVISPYAKISDRSYYATR